MFTHVESVTIGHANNRIYVNFATTSTSGYQFEMLYDSKKLMLWSYEGGNWTVLKEWT